jgi:GxxExxY protein
MVRRKEPQMNADERRFKQITERVIGCAYEIANRMGCGLLEHVYQNSMYIELPHAGLKATPQFPITIRYRDAVVGEYIADLFVEDALLVELKAVKALDDVDTAQCLNYVKATGLKICLLINFGKSEIEIRRIVNNF